MQFVAQPDSAIRRSVERRRADRGSLRSRHTFSFADDHDPAPSGFQSLRVLVDAIIAAGRGFPQHPHRDRETFIAVHQGSPAHRDSLGNEQGLMIEQIFDFQQKLLTTKK